MSFTPEEIKKWHEDKRRRETKPETPIVTRPVAICIHCHRPFGISEGVVTPEVAICDTCND